MSSKEETEDEEGTEPFDTNRLLRAALNGDHRLIRDMMTMLEKRQSCRVEDEGRAKPIDRVASLTVAFLDSKNEEGTDEFAKKYYSQSNQTLSGSTEFGALHLACAMGHVRVVRTLLRHGADVTLRSSTRETCLHLCTSGEIARMLLQRGADANARCVGGYTPLHVCDDEDGVATQLMAHGADVTKRTNGGSTPLHYVDTARMIDLLVLNGGADVNAMNAYGHTPLHLCTSHGDWRTALRLLRLGAKVDHRTHDDDDGRALSLRRRRGLRQRQLRSRLPLARRAMTPVDTAKATIEMLRNSHHRHPDATEEMGKLRRCIFVLSRWQALMGDSSLAVANTTTTSRTRRRRRRRSASFRARWGHHTPDLAQRIEREMIYGPFCGTWRAISKTSPYVQMSRGKWSVPSAIMRSIVEDYVGCEGFLITDEYDEATKKKNTSTHGRLPKRFHQMLRFVPAVAPTSSSRHRDARTNGNATSSGTDDDRDGRASSSCVVM